MKSNIEKAREVKAQKKQDQHEQTMKARALKDEETKHLYSQLFEAQEEIADLLCVKSMCKRLRTRIQNDMNSIKNRYIRPMCLYKNSCKFDKCAMQI